ncbi:MAG: hypothetical protein P8K81_00580, partial [Flavobacteriales bacterium]|nr:hypothetical protein [Flavobacteriales bacterium]
IELCWVFSMVKGIVYAPLFLGHFLHPVTIAGIEIELVRKRIKNVHLQIHTPDGRVTVSAPRLTSEAFIAEFVAAKAPKLTPPQTPGAPPKTARQTSPP